MRIESITIDNLLGARDIRVRCATPVQLFAGRNFSGKSSIRDAIALALTADLGRVALKKDAPQLVSDGATSGSVRLVTSDGDAYSVLITSTGKISDSQKGRHIDPTAPYVIDAQRFGKLSPPERRAFLFGLMGVQTDHATIGQKLRERGCEAAKVARVEPLLRAGFQAALDEAKAQGTAAKGAWRGVTGETYGSVKAPGWAPPAPPAPWNQREFDTVSQELAIVEPQIGQAEQQVGALQQAVEAAVALTKRRDALQPLDAEVVRRRVKLQHDEVELVAGQAALDTATARAGNAPRTGLLHDLAAALTWAMPFTPAGDLMVETAGAALAVYEAEHGEVGADDGDREELLRLPRLTEARDLMARSVGNSMRDLKRAEDAGVSIAEINRQLAEAPPPTTVIVEAAQQVASDLRARRRLLNASIDQMLDAKRAAGQAGQRQAEAAKHHADVSAWSQIADALSPDGIQTEMMAGALGPINARLAQSAVDAQWPAVLIDQDMTITANRRAYALLSESERYRCDALLAEAVAHCSGLRLLVLDRFDVLDLQGRADLLAWLDVLADAGEIDTALIFGTLAKPPTGLPETIAVHWVDGGVCVGVEAAAEQAA